MSTKAKKSAAAAVVKPKSSRTEKKKKSWRRLMWDAVSIYDVEAVSNSTLKGLMVPRMHFSDIPSASCSG